MGYSTPKKQLDLKEFLAQPAKKPSYRTGLSFRKAGGRVTGSTVAAVVSAPLKDDAERA